MSTLLSRRTIGCLLAGGLAAAWAPAECAVSAQDQSKRSSSLVAADSARFRAMVEHDIPKLERALADELVYVHTSSTRQTKSEHVADIRDGRAIYTRIDPKEQVPTLYGDTGIIQGIAAFATGTGERQADFTLRYTAVYVWREGRWQLAAFACSRIPDQAPTP